MKAKFELKKARNGQYHFNFLAGNGAILLQSEMYETKAAAIKCIKSVQINALMDERYDLLESKSGKPYFIIKAGNYAVIAQSQMYESETGRDNCVVTIKRIMANSTIEDLTWEV